MQDLYYYTKNQDIHKTEENEDFENYRAYLIFAVALIACCKIVSIYSPY